MELFGGDGKKDSAKKGSSAGRVICLVDLGLQEYIFLLNRKMIFFVVESVYIICNVGNE